MVGGKIKCVVPLYKYVRLSTCLYFGKTLCDLVKKKKIAIDEEWKFPRVSIPLKFRRKSLVIALIWFKPATFFSRPNAFDDNNSAIVTKTNKWRAPTQLPTLVGFFQASGKRTEMLKERRDVRGIALNGTREDSVHNWRKKIHKIK